MNKKLILIAILIAVSCSNIFGQELEKTKTGKTTEVEYLLDTVQRKKINMEEDGYTMLCFLFSSSIEELEFKMKKKDLRLLTKEEVSYFCSNSNLIIETVEKYNKYNFVVSLDTSTNFYHLIMRDIKKYSSCNLIVFLDTTNYTTITNNGANSGIKKFTFRSLLIKKKKGLKTAPRTLLIEEFSYIHTEYNEFPKYTVFVLKKKKIEKK